MTHLWNWNFIHVNPPVGYEICAPTNYQKETLGGWNLIGSTWRIIPISTWLVPPIYKPFRPLGDLLTMVFNHELKMVLLRGDASVFREKSKSSSRLPSGKLTWQWKMDLAKMYPLLIMEMFHCHVSLLERNVFIWDMFFGMNLASFCCLDPKALR